MAQDSFRNSPSSISHRRGWVRLGMLFVALALAAIAGSCNNKNDQPAISYSQAIDQYMRQNLDGLEFFETNMYASTSYAVDSSADSERRFMRSSQSRVAFAPRVTTSFLNSTLFGQVAVAIDTCVDVYFGQYKQTAGNPPVEITIPWSDTLRRRTLFYKLGPDADPYLGWSFVGFDLGRPLHELNSELEITVVGLFGQTRTLTSHTAEAELQGGGIAQQLNLGRYTYLLHIDTLRANDSVDIRSVKPLAIFARTSSGFRQLQRITTAAVPLKYHYGYRTPPADPNGRFFHLITFQEGPQVMIDSVFSYKLDTLRVDTIVPPDTNLDSALILQFMIDTTIKIDTFIFPDTITMTADTFIDTTQMIDTIVDSSYSIDTLIRTDSAVTKLDSVVADTNLIAQHAKIWAWPYSLR